MVEMNTFYGRKQKLQRGNKLTEMRLRNMIFDSGTPFFTSKEIAWTAEFPKIGFTIRT